LKKFQARTQPYARLILIWLASSLRPLTLSELAAAVSLPRPEFALRICTSILVTLIDENIERFVKLAHFSVREYLLSEVQILKKDKGVSQYRFSNELAHATVAERAVEYILGTNDMVFDRQTATNNPLLPYSTQYWHQHAREIGKNFANFPQLRGQINKIFSPEYSRSYLNWLKTYNCDNPYASTPKSRYPQPLYYASLLGLQEIVENLLKDGVDVMARGGRFSNALVAASVHGHSNIVTLLLAKYSKVESVHIEEIMENIESNIKETVEVLLNAGAMDITFREPQAEKIEVAKEMKAVILITEEIVKAAAGNKWNGKEVMTLLLDRRGRDVQITEKVVIEIARRFDKEVMTLLLDRRGGCVQITEEVVKAAAENWRNGKEVMTLLLDRRRGDVQITEEVVIEIARRFNKEVITLLLDRRGGDIQITEKVVIEIARRFGKEVMILLLDRRGGDVQITEEVVKAAAGNE
jgi:hypothetical protein